MCFTGEDAAGLRVRCRDLLALRSFKNIELVAGENGLDRVVRWPYVTLTHTIGQWVRGGELLFVSGVGYGQDEQVLIELLKESVAKGLAGMVVLIGSEYIHTIPEQMIGLADRYSLPLFRMPYRIPLGEPTEEISSLIVEKRLEDQSLSELLRGILSGCCEDEEAVVAKAAFYRFDLTGAHRVCAFLPELAGGEASADEMAALLELRSLADDLFKLHGCDVLTMLDYRTVVCLLPCRTAQTEQALLPLLDTVRRSLARRDGVTRVWAGVGRRYDRLRDMAKSREEAKNALKAVREENRDDRIGDFDALGIFKVFFDLKDLTEARRFCESTLGRLQEQDAQAGTHYLQTLEVYLEEDCNAVHAAQRLFLHRNSLNYRIRKIESILGKDLSRHADRLFLRDALLLRRFLRIAE